MATCGPLVCANLNVEVLCFQTVVLWCIIEGEVYCRGVGGGGEGGTHNKTFKYRWHVPLLTAALLI